MSRIPVWFDTDIGVDDAAALLVLSRTPETEVAGISAVAGNVPMERAYDNARRVAALAGLTCPVYRGAARPLYRELMTALHVHGDINFNPRVSSVFCAKGGTPSGAPSINQFASAPVRSSTGSAVELPTIWGSEPFQRLACV